MNTERFDNPLPPINDATLMDAVKRRALDARREAINEFWTAVGRGVKAAWHALRRARPGVDTPGRCVGRHLANS